MPLSPIDILFSEIHKQIDTKFHRTAVFYRVSESKKSRYVSAIFLPDGFHHAIRAGINCDHRYHSKSLGRIVYEVMILPFQLDSQKPGGHLELEIIQAIEGAKLGCAASDPYSLDSAFIACVQCEVALRMEKSDEQS